MVLFSGSGACQPHDRASVKVEVSSEPLSYNLEVPYKRPYLLSKFATLSLQAKKKVEEKVQAIGSELPIFVKVLSSNNADGIGCNTCEMVSLHTRLFSAENVMWFSARYL
jgi:hypothetical protein